eukprot:2132963-Prymnesium_polylepis.1
MPATNAAWRASRAAHPPPDPESTRTHNTHASRARTEHAHTFFGCSPFCSFSQPPHTGPGGRAAHTQNARHKRLEQEHVNSPPGGPRVRHALSRAVQHSAEGQRRTPRPFGLAARLWVVSGPDRDQVADDAVFGEPGGPCDRDGNGRGPKTRRITPTKGWGAR